MCLKEIVGAHSLALSPTGDVFIGQLEPREVLKFTLPSSADAAAASTLESDDENDNNEAASDNMADAAAAAQIAAAQQQHWQTI